MPLPWSQPTVRRKPPRLNIPPNHFTYGWTNSNSALVLARWPSPLKPTKGRSFTLCWSDPGSRSIRSTPPPALGTEPGFALPALLMICLTPWFCFPCCKHHRQRLRPLQLDDETTRTLAHLVEARRKAVDRRTLLLNQLVSTLKNYFPQALELVGEDLCTEMALD